MSAIREPDLTTRTTGETASTLASTCVSHSGIRFLRASRTRLRDRIPMAGPVRNRSLANIGEPPARLDHPLYPSVWPNWDNTPRTGRRGIVMVDSSPDLFRQHVRQALALARREPAGRRLLWIRSWNEWGEGNYLEPDRVTGLGYLEALREELDRLPTGDPAAPGLSARKSEVILRILRSARRRQNLCPGRESYASVSSEVPGRVQIAEQRRH